METDKKTITEKIVAHIIPNYGRYGRSGYMCCAVGKQTFFTNTLKKAKSWCITNGFDYIKL